MSGGAPAPLIDTASPGWIYFSDAVMTSAFICPLLSVSWYLLQKQLMELGILSFPSDAKGSSSTVSPEELASRAGGLDEQQRAADAAESAQVHKDAMAKAKAEV